MHRVNIVYATSDDNIGFDWRHYLDNHLALACGISSRHAPIIRCEVDRPVDINNPTNTPPSKHTPQIVAICTVFFSSPTTQNNFRHFFATGHKDSLQIIADEPNYTAIQPSFNAGVFKASDEGNTEGSFRVRFLFLRQSKALDENKFDAAAQELAQHFENQGIEITGTQIDHCQHDVPEDTESVYDAIASVHVENIAGLRQISRQLSADNSSTNMLVERLGIRPSITYSELINFDLALCKPYLRHSTENNQ